MNSFKISQFGIAMVVVLLLGVAVITSVSGRIFSKCSLARTLLQSGVSYDELPDWICLTEHESRFNTKAVNRVNYDGSSDWGLFQINDRYWCQPSDGRYSANVCRISCDELLSNDIRHAVNCAKIIKREQGLSAWVAWNNHCQGAKPWVGECF